MLDVSTLHLDLLRQLLQQRLPDAEVWAFGSRVMSWPVGRGVKTYSDLDLAYSPISGKNVTCDVAVAHLRADFEESRLPWRVDLTPLDDLPPDLLQLVLAHGALLQAGAAAPMQLKALATAR